jgi:hypothetical protein
LHAVLAAYPDIDGFFIDGPERWDYFQAYAIPNLSCAPDDCPVNAGEVWENESSYTTLYGTAYTTILSDPTIAAAYTIINDGCQPEFNAVSDGCLDEDAFQYNDRSFSFSDLKPEADWLRDVQWVSDTSTNEKVVLVYTGVNTTLMSAAERTQAERYEYASFLIAQNTNSTAMMAWSIDSVNELSYNALNDVDLGAPTGPYVADWQGADGVYEREYEKGIVLVHANKSGTAQTVTLAETYRTLDGDSVTGDFILEPNTGHILTWQDIEAPSVPANASATAESPTGIALAWDAAADNVAVTGYRIYRNGSLVDTVPTNAAYSDTGLASATAYAYRISAIDAEDNESAQSGEVSVTTLDLPDTTPPAGVTDLRAGAP